MARVTGWRQFAGNRRVGLIALLGLIAGASMRVSLPVQAAPPAAPPTPIKHIVVLYQENHSFDEVLGSLCFTQRRCDGLDVTKPVMLAGGVSAHLHASPDVVPNVNHSVASQQTAIAGGAMNGWESVPGCTPTKVLPGAIPFGCLTYYTRPQIHNLAALATRFGVADRTFSMTDSPSWGGHLYAVAATTDNFTGDNPVPPSPKPAGWRRGPGWGCNSRLVSPWMDPSKVVTEQPSCIPDPALRIPNGGAFEPTRAQYVPTIMDRMDAASLDWRIYAPARSALRAICPSFAECLYGPQLHDVVPSRQVITDAAHGSLPALSVVIPTDPNSQHNRQSMTVGDNWIGQVVGAIEKGPDWSSTAIFITYDDCGCFYDHVTPGKNPDGTSQGVRVPVVIVSPYARPAHTDSTPATFASILRYIESTFGVAPLGVNDAKAYDFSASFNYAQQPLPGAAMVQQQVHPVGVAPQDPSDPT